MRANDTVPFLGGSKLDLQIVYCKSSADCAASSNSAGPDQVPVPEVHDECAHQDDGPLSAVLGVPTLAAHVCAALQVETIDVIADSLGSHGQMDSEMLCVRLVLDVEALT